MADPTKIQPISIRNLGIYGLIREAEVDSNLDPDGTITEVMNMNFDRKGAVQLRPGLTALGATVSTGNSCLGMQNVQSNTMIVVFQNGTMNIVYSWSGSVWNSSLTGDTGGSKTRFIDFAGRTIRLNGVDSSVRAWNGSADGTSYWDYTGNPINPQQLSNNSIKPKFGDVYKSKVYVGGDSTNPDRLYFSSVISVSGNITWNPTTDYVDINPNDGENISAIRRYSLELDVFKPNYIYRFRTTGLDPDPLIKIGTRSPESIVEGKNGLYFHHDTGFYVYSGGYPTEISRPISDFVDAIPYSQFSSISGWKDNDHIYWYLGNLTVNEVSDENVTWKNVVIRYTESSQVWTIYSYANGLTRGMTFNNGSTLTRVVGTDNGIVATFNSGNTDIGEPIKYRVVTKWYEFEGIYNRKILQKIVSVCEKAQSSILMYRVDDNPAFTTLGQVKSYMDYFEPLTIKCHRIRFKLTGASSGEPLIWKGLEIPLGLNEGTFK